MARERGADVLAINGTPDHLHILIRSSENMPAANFMKELKGGSSKWINENNTVHGKFKWQAGYGWFSISPKDTDQVVDYIENQQQHHETVSFQAELRKFLTAYQIEYDERYVWD